MFSFELFVSVLKNYQEEVLHIFTHIVGIKFNLNQYKLI